MATVNSEFTNTTTNPIGLDMFEFVQVTAQYSNAVLVALMPYVSDFSKNLELPIPTPITTNQVLQFRCSPRLDLMGGNIVLTNGYEFSFVHGRVGLYRSPKCYFFLQDPDRIPEFYGRVKISEAEALQIAHQAIKKLGYTDAMLNANSVPEITRPIRVGTNVVPRYRIKWRYPNELFQESLRSSIDFEINATTKQVEMMYLGNTNTWRSNPEVSVQPTVIQKGLQSQPSGVGRKVFPVSQAYSNAFLVAILPQLSEYVKKAGFAVPLPITTDQVDMNRYICGLVESDPMAIVYLKRGDQFVYRHGQVIAFYSYDAADIPSEDQKRPEDFFGKVNMGTHEAIALVRKTIRQLGYSEKMVRVNEKPYRICPPQKYGTNFFARHFFGWENDDEAWTIVEVDATTKTMKSLYINERANTNLWRNPPKIDVSPESEK